MVEVSSTADGSVDGRGQTARNTYQRIARWYDLVDLPFEYLRYRKLRPLLFRGSSGDILDAGVGTGRNMPFYPAGSQVVGIDVSPAMIARAERRRATSPAEVRLAEMDVRCLDLPDGAFDAVVASFLFCTLPEEHQAAAIGELGRVLKPGGTLRLLEYTRPTRTSRRIIARMWEPWTNWAFGASFDRHPERHLADNGLQLRSTNFVLDDCIRLIEASKDAVPGTQES